MENYEEKYGRRRGRNVWPGSKEKNSCGSGGSDAPGSSDGLL